MNQVSNAISFACKRFILGAFFAQNRGQKRPILARRGLKKIFSPEGGQPGRLLTRPSRIKSRTTRPLRQPGNGIPRASLGNGPSKPSHRRSESGCGVIPTRNVRRPSSLVNFPDVSLAPVSAECAAQWEVRAVSQNDDLVAVVGRAKFQDLIGADER